MDAFEVVIADLMRHEGFWVQTSYKVNLTKEDKLRIDRPSTPRWEIDVVAYRPGDNLLRVIECKSFLDSPGVGRAGFDPASKNAKRYKLFNEPQTRAVLFSRLLKQLEEAKAIQGEPTIELCLAAGNIKVSHLTEIQTRFDQEGWNLLTPDWIRESLRNVTSGSYENSPMAVTAKLLLRQ